MINEKRYVLKEIVKCINSELKKSGKVWERLKDG